MNRECSVSKRVQTPQGLRYCPVILSGNGKIKPDAVLVNGKEERHSEGSYYISWYEGKRLMRLSVGTHATVRVSHKRDRGWTPKAYKEREIPIPAKLVKSLKAWKAKANKTCPLVFSTSGCNVKMNFLDDLKAVAERANLDQDNFWLHKFRATFATRHLWNGVDLRTVQMWLGHSDMESTMRYLKARLCLPSPTRRNPCNA